ncbi:MAG TPA: FkbM family methyltransferase, partial [Thermoanaerobaculia bacterium]|nr:FkbM family methyltransferase [Thermoanaerobaculia bacterium]
SSIDTPTTTLDELVSALKIEPDLVKIDVEGAERLVLEGARELAHRGNVTFIVEMHSNPELSMAANGRAVLDWCQRMSYEAWYMTEPQKVTTPDVFAHRGRCHLLLIPRGLPYPDCLVGIKQQGDTQDSPAWQKRRRKQDRELRRRMPAV